MSRLRVFSSAIATAMVAASVASAQQIDNKVVIITSFSKDVTAPFAQAFEKKYPGTKARCRTATRRRRSPISARRARTRPI